MAAGCCGAPVGTGRAQVGSCWQVPVTGLSRWPEPLSVASAGLHPSR